MKHTQPDPSAPGRRALHDWHAQNWALDDNTIAARLGCTPAAVAAARKRLGKPPAPRTRTPSGGAPRRQVSFTLNPASQRALNQLARDLGMSRSRIVEKALTLYHQKHQ